MNLMLSLTDVRKESMVEELKFTTPQAALRAISSKTRTYSPPTEKVSVASALGRVVAEDIKSPYDIPAFTRPWVDGYATKSIWTEAASDQRPVILSLAGKLFPEDYPASCNLRYRETYFAACGAPLPTDADCVVRAEDAEVVGSEVRVMKRARRGDGLSRVGEDLRRGSFTVRRHQTIGPQDIGLLVAVGRREVLVFQKPKLGILSVGNEITDLDHFAANRITNNYAYVISAAATELGAEPTSLGIATDDRDAIAAKLNDGIRRLDAIATIGGCSVGPRDLVPDAIRKLGEVIVHGVKIRPGHVAGAGIIDGKPVFMLPGHISSCTMAFYVFLVPTLARFAGTKPDHLLPSVQAESSTSIEKAPTYTFLRLRLKKSSGSLLAEPVHGGTNILTSLSKANGFALIPPSTAIRRGQKLTVTLFSRLEHARFA